MAKRPRIAQTIGGMIDHAVGEAIDVATGAVKGAGKIVGSVLSLPGITHAGHQHRVTPGGVAGIESHEEINTPPAPDAVAVHVIDYAPDNVTRRDVTIDGLVAFLAEPLPDGVAVRWINVDGLHAYVVQRFRETFGYHTLAAEDVLHVPQRPKLEPFHNHLFIITRMLQMVEQNQLHSEQISIFLHERIVVTFQESAGDCWDPIRKRIETPGSKLRTAGADYLVYALLDAIVDHGFPILERYGDLLERLEQRILKRPTPHELSQINAVKRELSLLRRVMWPMRELVSALNDDELELVRPATRAYLRDVYEHTVQLVDLVETFREMAAGLTDLHMSAVSNRMNEVMKVLTIMASLFIPTTFLAGLWGMNFEEIPWMHEHAGFWTFVIICAAIMFAMTAYFWHKGWIGRRG